MIRVAIAVEGRTEEEFVKNVLADHLRTRDVEPTPVLLGGRGGRVTVERLASEMAKLFWAFDRVTSIVDFYGFRGNGGASRDSICAIDHWYCRRQAARS